jgi:hypothetical protein
MEFGVRSFGFGFWGFGVWSMEVAGGFRVWGQTLRVKDLWFGVGA